MAVTNLEETVASTGRLFAWKTVFYVVGIAWASLAYGYIASVIGTTIGQPSFLTYMGTEVAEGGLLSLVVGLFYAGGLVGAFVSAPLSDKFGRKWTTFAGSLLTLISNGISAGSVNAGMFIAFRCIVGFASTILFTVVPVWISEVVPPRGRGAFVDAHPILITFGYTLSAWVGTGFYYVQGNDQQWRGPIAIGCFPCLLSLISIPFLPESPRWLMMQGKETQAYSIIHDLHKSGIGNSANEFSELEFEEIKRQVEIDRSLRMGYMGMLKRPSYRKRILIGSGLIFFLEASGALVINNYGTVLYGQLGFDVDQRLFLQGGFSAVGFLTNFLAISIVDRLPRPVLMTIGFVGCLSCLIVETAIQAVYLDSDNQPALRAGVAMLYLFIFMYGMFLDGSTFFYIGEIFPNHLRAQGMTIAMAVLNLMSLVWQIAAQYAFTNIGWKYYLPFIVISAIAAVVIPLTFPDTKDKPLEEIAALFGDADIVAPFTLEGNESSGNHDSGDLKSSSSHAEVEEGRAQSS